MSEQIKIVASKIHEVFSNLFKNISSFEVLSEEVLPYGLKQHTRSICWLAEQVLLQNVRKRQKEYGISNYKDPESDISAWDACISLNASKTPAYLNIKVSDITKPIRRNDIASVKKLISFYKENPEADLFYVVIMLKFEGNKIHFCDEPIVRYYPWIGDFVVNSRNHHIQCYYKSSIKERTVSEFIELIKSKASARNIL